MTKSENFDLVQKGTYAMFDLWLYNFARNISKMHNGKSVKKLNIFSNKDSRKNHEPVDSAIVIGAGPSVIEKNHLEIISNSNYEGTIICTDRMLQKCLKKDQILLILIKISTFLAKNDQ